MKGVVFRGDRNLEILDFDDPTPGPGDAVIERDNASDKGQAINLANQAADRDRAVLVLGPSSTADTMAVVPVFDDKRVPSMGFAGSDAILKSGPWTLKFRQNSEVDSPLLAQYVLEKTPVRKVALVFDRTNEGMIDFKNVFRDAFKAKGETIAAEEAVVSSDSNFLPLATSLRALEVDAVYFSTYAGQSANIALQLRQAGLLEKVRFIGSLATASPKYVSVAGKAGEGTLAASDYGEGIRAEHEGLRDLHRRPWRGSGSAVHRPLATRPSRRGLPCLSTARQAARACSFSKVTGP